MFKICLHDWYIFRSLTDSAIETAARNPKVDIDLYPSSRLGLIYKEKICLECKKYINEIEKRHNYWMSKIYKDKLRNIKRRERAKLLRDDILNKGET